MAVSNTNEPMEFYLSSGTYPVVSASQLIKENEWSFSSSLKKPTGHLRVFDWVKFQEKTQVNCCRLDDFEPLRGQIIDFMWVDVQGAEDLVFSAAEETLYNTRYVYTEYSNDSLYEGQLTLTQLLRLFGPSWQVMYDYGGDVLLRNKRFVQA
jgi:FkbM family methyltransferase